MEDLSYMRTEYGREKDIESYIIEAKQKERDTVVIPKERAAEFIELFGAKAETVALRNKSKLPYWDNFSRMYWSEVAEAIREQLAAARTVAA